MIYIKGRIILSKINILHFVTNLVYTYCFYLFLTTLHKKESLYSKKIQILSYMTFYIILTSVFSFIRIPYITMIINVIGIFLLSFLYSYNTLFNLQVAIITYSITMFLELVFVYTSNSKLEGLFVKMEHKKIFIIFIYVITLLIIAVLLKYFLKNGTNKISKVPLFNLLISLISIIIVIILISKTNISREYLPIILSLFLLINIISIFGYDRLVSTYDNIIEIEKLKEKTKSYEKELKFMNETIQTTRKYKHDEKNHILVLQGLIEEKSYDKISAYLKEVIKNHEMDEVTIKSKNEIINSILNYKIGKMIKNNIEVTTYIDLKENLPISDYDISIILGNIIDNAMDAVIKIKEDKRKIDIKITDERNKFIIFVKNTYDGKILLEGKELKTTKKNKNKHGIGIKNIKNSVEKYDGFYKTKFDEKEFISSVIILYD